MKIQLLSLAAAGLLTAACAPIEPVPPGDGPSQCRADRYQQYIGRNRSELPPKPANETWRVTCTTCPVTEDYSPHRLNIFFNEQTDIIEQVRCG